MRNSVVFTSFVLSHLPLVVVYVLFTYLRVQIPHNQRVPGGACSLSTERRKIELIIVRQSVVNMETEILVVGAGIHSLSFTLRYIDDKPDLVDEVSRSQFYMKEREAAKVYGDWSSCRKRVEKWTRSGHESKSAVLARKKQVTVVDPSGKWLHEWRSNFAAFEIPFLRSPMDIHPSPRDPRDLYAFAVNERRSDEFTIMDHTHGKVSHGFTGPHQLPSTPLFSDFCDMLIRCFGLEDHVHKGYVMHVEDREKDANASRRYKVTLADDSVIYANHVVMAPRPAMSQDPCFQEPECAYPEDRLIRAHQLAQWLTEFKQQARRHKGKEESVLIVGGGITSGHVAKVAHKLGLRPILTLRSSVKVQQFDVDFRWMGQHRSSLIENFRQKEELPDRMCTCFRERKSSFSPEVHRILCKLQSKGEIDIFPDSSVTSLYWEPSENHWVARLDNGVTAYPAYIWLAIGTDVQLDQYPMLMDLMTTHPIPSFCGFPAVEKDLKWRNDTSIYLLGALSLSRLGPDGLNMAGARHGSILVARALRDLVDK